MEEIDWQLKGANSTTGQWHDFSCYVPQIIGETALYTEPGAESFRRGMQVFEKCDYAPAILLFEQAGEKSISEQAKYWANMMRLAAVAGERIEGGKRVNLASPEFFPAWFFLNDQRAKMEMRKDGLLVTFSSDGPQKTFWATMARHPVGDFEIVARFEILEPKRQPEYIDLLLLARDFLPPHLSRAEIVSLWESFGIGYGYYPKERVAVAQSERGDLIEVKLQKEFTARIVCKDGMAYCWLNNVSLCDGYPLKESARIWLSSFLGASHSGTSPLLLKEYSVRRMLPGENLPLEVGTFKRRGRQIVYGPFD